MSRIAWASEAGIPPDRGAVVTVGTFDGVHLGHWSVLQEIRARAGATGRRGVLVTFDPHPLRIVRPADAPLLLTTPGEKKEILAESGLSYAVFLTFTPTLAKYEPRRFVEEILVERMGVEELVIGYDHGFGRDRSGDAETLRRVGEELGFAVDVVPPVIIDGAPVSSSRIRSAIRERRLDEARACLGRPYSFNAVVVRGEGRGRGLGFPTANLRVGDPQKLIPPPGVYAAAAYLRRGRFTGALHLGPRPTFPGSPPSIEIHLLDFQGDIYGEEVRVDLLRHIRDVRPFESVQALLSQLRHDVDAARAVVDADSGIA